MHVFLVMVLALYTVLAMGICQAYVLGKCIGHMYWAYVMCDVHNSRQIRIELRVVQLLLELLDAL